MVIEYNGRKKNGSAHRLQLQKLYEKPKREKNSDSIELFTGNETESDHETGTEDGMDMLISMFEESQVGPTF